MFAGVRGESRGGEGDTTAVCENGEEGGSEGGRGGGGGGGVSEEEGSTKTSEGSVGVEEGVAVGVVRPVTGGGGGEGMSVAKEPENEFMLDGFDFSTSEFTNTPPNILYSMIYMALYTAPIVSYNVKPCSKSIKVYTNPSVKA